MASTFDDTFREELLGDQLRDVFLHWNKIRGNRAMPERREVDPAEIRRALCRVWIYEREEDGEFRCRLAGEEINTAYGKPLQGRLAREMIGPKFDEIVEPRWNYVLDRGAFFHGYSVESAAGHPIERLCLPLADKDGRPKFVFGASHYFDSTAAKLYQNSFKFISLNVIFYHLPTFQRMLENAPV